ncbi:YafY family protein [Parvibaculum sp.]|uniref:helix-turn-helix transcriptional regulator n=1 Tax=Parvibaculum sp. TaxID=2024848 RepID=UPI002723C4EC|nr:YafY family protein [Parvibaculum sp.]MDO9125714.1 YafY family protein [Parvibaculum sp.]MDP1626207.1 YafY family protein [Parvibaculum sp.]MDP2151524.1 YafY family protein [Parvibaculum sp.]MDP3326786.1 YafY family protein [Parvibaculum sp.]
MRRADRLFDIIEFLRRNKRVVTAQELAEKLEVSVRTIYRDVADLQASRVPIEGEAGLGYVLRSGYELPPLMFTEDEIEALVFGARMVRAWGDAAFTQAADAAVAKIRAVLPERLERIAETTRVTVAPGRTSQKDGYSRHLSPVRRAIRERRKLSIDYEALSGEKSRRTVRPLGLAFFGPFWMLAAWCEKRNDFRTFRIERIGTMKVTEEVFADEKGKTIEDFIARPSESSYSGLPQPHAD